MSEQAAERPLRVVVVEDERLARESLVRMLRGIPWIEVAGEADDGPSAVAALASIRPDVALMDVRLPGYDALEVLGRLGDPPAVIFVTAYQQHAIAAFELAAIDYVLKPVDHQRLLIALERARRAIGGDGARERARRALESAEPLTTLFVRDRGAIVALPIADITRFEADDTYVRIMVRGRQYLMQTSLNEVERRLPPGRFLRVHRGHLVNLQSVAKFVPYEGSRFAVELTDGTRVLASRRYSQQIRELAR